MIRLSNLLLFLLLIPCSVYYGGRTLCAEPEPSVVADSVNSEKQDNSPRNPVSSGLSFPLRDGSSETSETLMILPFTHDKSPNADLVAIQSAWILQKKLRAGKFRFQDPPEKSADDPESIWEKRFRSEEFLKTGRLNWLVSGVVQKIGLNRQGEWRGNRFLGVVSIPIEAEITVMLHDCSRKTDLFSKTYRANDHIPRLRIFGINRSPFPRSPKTIDAFIHDTIMSISEDILAAIRSNRVEESD